MVSRRVGVQPADWDDSRREIFPWPTAAETRRSREKFGGEERQYCVLRCTVRLGIPVPGQGTVCSVLADAIDKLAVRVSTLVSVPRVYLQLSLYKVPDSTGIVDCPPNPTQAAVAVAIVPSSVTPAAGRCAAHCTADTTTNHTPSRRP